MRIVNITEEGRIGGPQVRIADVAVELRHIGVETVIVCPEQDSKCFREKLGQEHVPHLAVKLQRLSSAPRLAVNWLLQFIPDIRRIAQAIRRAEPDVVHCNGAWQFKSVVAANIAGVATIWHLNDCYTPMPVRIVFKQLANWLADGFIASSHRTQRYYRLEECFPNRPSAVIQAPVDVKEYNPNSGEEAANLSDWRDKIVVTVATINPLKDFETFLRAVDEVRSEYDGSVGFVVVGPIYDSQKDYGRKIKRMAERTCGDDVKFIGHSDAVKTILKSSDVYMCSSKTESSPIAVWEAMAMGLPVVATDVGDLQRFMNWSDHGRFGFVVDVGNYRALGNRVTQLLNEEVLARKYGRNARDVAERRLDIGMCARKHRAIYEKVTDVGV